MSLHNGLSGLIQNAANAYGANADILSQMANLESGGRNVVNNWDSNAAAGHPSAGAFQFIEPTFNSYSAQAQRANPNAWRGVSHNWRDPQAQALTTAWAITHGKGNAWTTYKRAVAAAGGNATGHSVPALASAPASSTQATAPTAPAFDWSMVTKDPVVQRILQGGYSQNNANTQSASSPTPTQNTSSQNNQHTTGSVVLNDYRDITRFGEAQFGLAAPTREQTTGGHHAANSYHYKGEAVDFGDANNSRHDLFSFANYAKQHPSQFKELYYNPLGWGIRNGHIVKGLTVAGHDDHLHVAV